MNHDLQWFDVGAMCAITGLLTWFIVYSWKHEKIFAFPGGKSWIYKSERPVWFKWEIRFYIILDILFFLGLLWRISSSV